MEVIKDIGAARPKGIMLEDALWALRKEYKLELESSYTSGIVTTDFYKGDGIQVRWVAAFKIGIPSLEVKCEKGKWYEVRAFLQRSGFFREYPTKKEKKG